MRFFILMLTLGGLVLGGCGEQVEAEAESWVEQISEIRESETGALLRVEIGGTGGGEIDVAGIVRVRAVMEWEPGVSVELIEGDWEEAGWTVGRTNRGEIRFDGLKYVQAVEFELWPYLAGAYEVPSLGIRAESEGAGKRIARVLGVGVVVSSVLEESDTGELDAAVGLAAFVAAENEETSNGWIVGGAVGVVIACCVVIVLVRGRGESDSFDGLGAKAVLGVAAVAPALSETDLRDLHRAMVELSGEFAGLGGLASELEIVRFSGGDVDQSLVQGMARRGVEICGAGGVRV